jgi:alpha-tubulin suppressor-like RCC1 family protein
VGDAAVTSYIVTAVNESSAESEGVISSSPPVQVPVSSGTFKVRVQAVNSFGPGRLTEFETGVVVPYSGVALYGTGQNRDGELGDGTTIDRSSPVQVGALINWSSVSTGGLAGAAVKSDGTMWAWGSNSYGDLGDGTAIFRSSPVQIGALTNWYQISARSGNGMHAVKTDGTLWGWGDNRVGQVGDESIVDRSSPVQVGVLTNWSTVASGSSFCVAVKTDGTIWSWGTNANGKLGLSIAFGQQRSSPVQIGTLTNWHQVDVSSSHVTAVKADGTLWCWGDGGFGCLGTGNTTNRSSPVQVGALTNWAQATAGTGSQSGAVKTDGTLWMWGSGGGGKLGDGTTNSRSSPVQIGALTDWSQISAGAQHTVALTTGGEWYGWGDGRGGVFGETNDFRSSPVQVGALTDWLQVSAGVDHTTALLGVV